MVSLSSVKKVSSVFSEIGAFVFRQQFKTMHNSLYACNVPRFLFLHIYITVPDSEQSLNMVSMLNVN